MSFRTGVALAERGLVPERAERGAIRRLLARRLEEAGALDQRAFVAQLGASPIALATDLANQQHYEVPAEFFELVLGPHRKYSGCLWTPGVETLEQAEAASLDQVTERACLADGQRVLELGCGWGAFSLYAARRFPNARVVAVSNSRSQASYINVRRPPNLRVITADMNRFEPQGRFDRIVSIEMLEHMRNYAMLFRRISGWLESDGRFFAHVFCHRDSAYPFEASGDDDWMARHFFTGGVMPSVALFRSFADSLRIEAEWTVGGLHYARTAAAWRANLEARRDQVMPVLRSVYGAESRRWYHRWRLFFLACEELFAYGGGTEWLVGHYRFIRA